MPGNNPTGINQYTRGGGKAKAPKKAPNPLRITKAQRKAANQREVNRVRAKYGISPE